MAPIRRYLRISKYSVLECRIYVDNPALAESWLLNSRNPILPRVIEKVRPLVLPKLREEQERSKSKGKKKGVKDIVSDGEWQMPSILQLSLIKIGRGLRGIHLPDGNKYTTFYHFQAEILPRYKQESYTIEFRQTNW